MKKIGIVVHGGAGPDSDYIKQHAAAYKKGIEEAIETGYQLLERGHTALDAVEAAVKKLEDNPLFNAGKGSALNAKAEVEMCASIMDGKLLKSGAVAIVKNVRNPVTLARAVMEKTPHIYLGAAGAMDYAKTINIALEPDAYFITEHQYQKFEEKRKKEGQGSHLIGQEQLAERMHGTVGAVALDQHGNIAAATSTGGMENNKEGRIADSSMIGVGCYAHNATCAISTTGDGEYLIRHVTAHNIAALIEYKGLSLPEAAYYFIHEKCKEVKGDMGLIGIDVHGNIALEFNSERMHRGWRTSDKAMEVFIYP